MKITGAVGIFKTFDKNTQREIVNKFFSEPNYAWRERPKWSFAKYVQIYYEFMAWMTEQLNHEEK